MIVLEVVVGFPHHVTVHPAAGATIRVAYIGGRIGIDLASGERIEPREPIDAIAPLDLRRTTLERDIHADSSSYHEHVDAWVVDGSHHLLATPLGSIVLGTDDRLLTIHGTSIELLDRVNGELRSVALPHHVDLHDPVTGGAGGQFSAILVAGPDHLVIARTPSLMILRIADLWEAVGAERVTWSITRSFPLRERDLAAPAKRGVWNRDSVITEDGSIAVATRVDPVGVRDRWWPGCGWTVIDLADGTTVEGRSPPALHVETTYNVTTRRLFVPPPKPVNWPAAPRLTKLPPPPGFEDLADGVSPSRLDEAVAYADRVRLEDRIGAYGPLGPPAVHLHALAGPGGDRFDDAINDWVLGHVVHQGSLYEATAYAIPAIVAIAADPATHDRWRVGSSVAVIAALARRTSERAAPVRFALRHSLPVLLHLEDAHRGLVDVWSLTIAIIASYETDPAWFAAACKRRRQLELLDDETIDARVDELDI